MVSALPVNSLDRPILFRIQWSTMVCSGSPNPHIIRVWVKKNDFGQNDLHESIDHLHFFMYWFPFSLLISCSKYTFLVHHRSIHNHMHELPVEAYPNHLKWKNVTLSLIKYVCRAVGRIFGIFTHTLYTIFHFMQKIDR